MNKRRQSGKKLSAVFIFILAVCFAVIFYTPIHFYNTCLDQGIQSDYLKLSPHPAAILFPSKKNVFVGSQKHTIDERWHSFHFVDFQLPLPVRHPEYITLPIVDYELGKTLLGVKLLDAAGDPILELSLRPISRLELSSDENKIFHLPIYQEDILAHPATKIWEDLFALDVSLLDLWKRNPLSLILYLVDIRHRDLIYNLYILYQREKFFREKVTSIQFYSDKQLGLVVAGKKDGEKSWTREFWYLLREGIVYNLEIKRKDISEAATRARDIILENIEVSPSKEDSAITLYNEFKLLPYQRKTDQEGMMYMISAWGHVIDNKEFLREMIQFLERGKENAMHLTPLYTYALKKYGTSFSKVSSEFIGQESASAKSERKAKDDLERELEKEGTPLPDQGGNFDNAEDKVLYYLQKAKKSGVNSDQQSFILEKH